MSWSELVEQAWFANAVSTALLIVGILLARRLAVRAILRRQSEPPEILRRWVINTRNVAIAVLLFGVVLIWGPELRAFALSLAAFVVAAVIAAKELILNLLGGLYRTGNRTFAVGERIEVSGVRGDIIDKSLLSTTVLEIGPGHTSHRYTGRAVVVPNSVLLTQPIYSETYTEEFGFHLFTVPLSLHEDWSTAEKLLLEAAQQECAAFIDKARGHMETLRRAHGLPSIRVDPQVTLQLPEPGRINLLVRVPVPVRRSGAIEQAILRRYLASGRQPGGGLSAVRSESSS